MELTNKTIAFLGDSITEGFGVEKEKNRYDQRLKRNCGLKEALNYGIGGTRMAHQHMASIKPRWDLYFCGRAYLISQKADMIVVFGGTNDYGHGDAPFGTMEDRTPDTFCGAVEFLMELLKELHPGKPVVFLTPARREGDEKPGEHEYKQPDALPLRRYAEVILTKGAEKGIPVLDVNRLLSIDPNRPEDKAAYTADGLHLNDAGHEKLAALLQAFLESL